MTEPAPPAVRSRAGPLRWRRWLPRAVFESVLIVLSIFLALALDQWWAERETHQRVQEARAYLAQEVSANRRTVLAPTGLAYHEKIHDLLREIVGSERPDPALMQRYQDEFRGVRPFNPQDVVWSSVSSGDLAQNLAFGELFMLARISSEQAQLEELHRAVFNALLQPSAQTADPDYQRSQADSLRSYLNDVVHAERRLIELYDQALRVLPPAPATNT